MRHATISLLSLTTAIATLLWSPHARACGAYVDLDELAVEAVSTKPETAKRAITLLRAHGQAGLDALFTAHKSAIDAHRAKPTHAADDRWQRIAAALDGVAAQKDAWAAGLYWHTDLEQAKRLAGKENKPILSLRLLGTLDTEFSCANSRFFRTVLYANADVAKHLRDNFVLHWQSHRPVPKLTIDFGDGRVIERTITGNSAHYVLTPSGNVVDVLPGLYGPAAFLRGLANAQTIAALDTQRNFESRLVAYHRERGAAVRTAWARDLERLGRPAPTAPVGAPGAAAGKPDAVAAARIAVGKSAVELRPVLAIVPDRKALESTTDEQTWAAIAALHAPDARLDAGSRAVIASKGLHATGADAVAANDRTRGKRVVEDPLVRLIRTFERSVAQDTVRNEYALHAQVHDWFATGTAPRTLDDLNERVYAELFLMPKTDPWLGLVPADAYTALPRETTVTGR